MKRLDNLDAIVCSDGAVIDGKQCRLTDAAFREVLLRTFLLGRADVVD